MSPADNNTLPEPSDPSQVPEEVKKKSFWAKLFGKKEDQTAILAPKPSQTPEPQLDDSAPSELPDNPAPTAQNTASQEPDSSPVPADDSSSKDEGSEIGPLESPTTLVNDTDGNVISPSVAVPEFLQSKAEGRNPTLPVAPGPEQPQADQPQAPQPQSDDSQTPPPAAPTQNQ